MTPVTPVFNIRRFTLNIDNKHRNFSMITQSAEYKFIKYFRTEIDIRLSEVLLQITIHL